MIDGAAPSLAPKIASALAADDARAASLGLDRLFRNSDRMNQTQGLDGKYGMVIRDWKRRFLEPLVFAGVQVGEEPRSYVQSIATPKCTMARW
jgi:hypothetical protein